MQSLRFPDKPMSVLCLGAHCDDIEIGCGGSLLRWIREKRVGRISFAVFCSDEKRARESAKALKSLAGKTPHTLRFLGLRDGFLPQVWSDAKEIFEALARENSYDLVVTHARVDGHQDHRTVAELTWNTFRNHIVMEYEIPKFDGDLGQPNAFVNLSEADVRKKLKVLATCFPSQAGKPWFHEELFLGLLRVRGMESRSPSGYAEAFHLRKAVF